MNFEHTQIIYNKKNEEVEVKDVLANVYSALKEKGYNIVNQLVGYLWVEIQHISLGLIMQEGS